MSELCTVCKLPEAESVFNIKLKMVHICEDCANSIAIQQVRDLVHQVYVLKSEGDDAT